MKVIYMINSRCNTNCFHCYRNKNSTEKNVNECENDIRCLMDQGHEIRVAGAEVLCDLEKIRLFKLANQEELRSNGILLANNPTIFKILSSFGIKNIILSWHIGFPELIKSILESITLQAIENIQEEGFDLRVTCVIANSNFDRINEIVERLIEKEVKEVEFIQITPTNEKVSLFLLNEYQKETFFNQVIQAKERHGKDILCIRLHANFNSTLTEKSKLAKQSKLFCNAGANKGSVMIETDGRIYPCPLLTADKYCIGHMRDGQMIFTQDFDHDGRNCIAEKLLMPNMEGNK